MLFEPEQSGSLPETPAAEPLVGVGFSFDWQAGAYRMEGGTPLEVTGTRAVQAWLEQVLRTERDRYVIYPADFGAPAQALIGRKTPRGMLLSELHRQMQESAARLDVVQDVGQLKQVGSRITGTVALDAGTDGPVTVEVTYEP